MMTLAKRRWRLATATSLIIGLFSDVAFGGELLIRVEFDWERGRTEPSTTVISTHDTIQIRMSPSGDIASTSEDIGKNNYSIHMNLFLFSKYNRHDKEFRMCCRCELHFEERVS